MTQFGQANDSVPAFYWSDLVFCARYEMVVHLDDLLRRRIPLFILTKMTPLNLVRLPTLSPRRWRGMQINCVMNWQFVPEKGSFLKNKL